MKTNKRPRPVGLALAAIASLLAAGALVLEHQLGRTEVPEGPWPPAKLAEARLLPAPATPPAGESETVGRPLFVPSRRPAPPAPVVVPARMAKDQFQLQGTIVVGGYDVAMLREKQTGKVVRVEKGAPLGDMTLAEVYPDRVVLRAGEETATLNLVVAAGPPTSPRGGAPGAPAAAVLGQQPPPGVVRSGNEAASPVPQAPSPAGDASASSQAPASSPSTRTAADRMRRLQGMIGKPGGGWGAPK